jgi:cytochrome c oxidase assembly factor CtaG
VKNLSIALGVAVLWIAEASPLSHLDHHFLTAHMAQHLLNMTVAAPLILLGARSTVVRWRPRPVLCWLAGTLTVIVWHVPTVFEMALRSHWWHVFQQGTFFTAGILFWWPVVRMCVSTTSSACWSVPVYLMLATLPCDALSAFLAFTGDVVYRPYARGAGHVGLSPLEDQALAAALMWVAVTFVYLIPALVVTAKLLSGKSKAVVQIGVQ